MADRFDEMAKALLDNTVRRYDGPTWSAVSAALRTAHNEAIEAVAKQYDGTAHGAFARAIRELKEPKR